MNRSKNRYKRVKWLFGKEIEIPEEWKLEKLGNICKIRKGSSISSDLYIGLEHIGQGNNQIENIGNANKFTSTKNIFVQDDVLYGKLRPLLNKVWLATESGYCSTDILPLIPTSKILSRILLFVLTNHDFLWYAVGTSAGTKMPRTSWLDMKKFPVVLPSIQEQQKIASILSAVDTAIVYTQKVIEKAEELKKGLMQKLLTRGIGHTKFKKVKWHFGKEIEIPEDWKIEKLEENSTLKGRIGWQGLTTAEYQETGGYYLVTGTDFKNGKIDWKNCVYVNKIRYVQDQNIQLKNEDVLVTKDGTIGKVAYIFTMTKPATLNSGIFVIRPIDMKYSSLFLFYILNSFYFFKFLNRLQAGSTINHLYQKDFVNFQFPLPNLHEQNKIASILSEIGAYIQKNQECKKKLEQLKKGLMQKLLTGQIRIKIDH